MSINQSHINARTVAAGDVHHYPARITTFDVLYEKIREEMAGQASYNETLDILKRHIQPSKNDIRSLEVKLTEAELQHLINYAKEVKELFAKKLAETQYLRSAQELYAHLLSKIRVDFNNKIHAKIGLISKEHISSEVTEKLVDPIFELLGENPLLLTHEDILGMIYFLTGNCYFDWK